MQILFLHFLLTFFAFVVVYYLLVTAEIFFSPTNTNKD